jgi:hypothetical protein
MRWLLGSSYFEGGKNGQAFRRAFVPIWHANIAKQAMQPTRIVVISEGGSRRPWHPGGNTDVVQLTGDCGHCEQLVENKRPNEFSGWSASMTALAMMAYTDMAHFVYWEEDMLGFGDVIGQGFRDLGDADLVFGRKMKSPPWQPCAQAFFIVRHSFIPQFVSMYLGMGGERDRNNLGEAKFVKIEQRLGPQRVRRLSFGTDRERPIPWDDPTWYCQQFSPAELDEARRRNLI